MDVPRASALMMSFVFMIWLGVVWFGKRLAGGPARRRATEIVVVM